MAVTPEGRVKRDVKKYLSSLPLCWFYMPVQNGMGITGIPDILACINGRFVGIETKAPGKLNTVTVNQAMQLDNIRKAAGFSIVVDSVHDLKIWLEKMGLV